MVRSSLACFVCGTLFYFGNFINYGTAQRERCRTPDRVDGTCIDVMQCQPMLQLLGSLKRPIPTTTTRYLNAFKCGTGDVNYKVCCPPGPIILASTASAPENQVQPPDVTNHRNLKLLPAFCGYLDTGERIVNGENAFMNEFPWMALLKYNKGKGSGFLCGGTIIHKNYILTAAHCLAELKPGQELVSVRVGDYSINNETDCVMIKNKSLKCNPPVQDLQVEEIIPHPQFGGKRGSIVNDIGLVRVSTINLDVENARPVCLPIGLARDKRYRNAIVTGWGVSDIRTGASSDILQKVGLPVTDKESCIKLYNDSGLRIVNTQLCLGGTTSKDSCSGDSGGPMLVPTIIGDSNIVYIQQGIVSYGPRWCGITGYPGVYTLVKYYMDWILDNIRP